MPSKWEINNIWYVIRPVRSWEWIKVRSGFFFTKYQQFIFSWWIWERNRVSSSSLVCNRHVALKSGCMLLRHISQMVPWKLRDGAEAKCRDRKEPLKKKKFTYAFEFIDINSINLYNLHYSRIKILKNTYQHNMKMLWCVFIFCIGTWGFGGVWIQDY